MRDYTEDVYGFSYTRRAEAGIGKWPSERQGRRDSSAILASLGGRRQARLSSMRITVELAAHDGEPVDGADGAAQGLLADLVGADDHRHDRGRARARAG